DDILATYGDGLGTQPEPVPAIVPKKSAFLAWHHPVKQVVRDHQWAALTRRLIEERAERRALLRYFTLPGSDLLDVRVLAEVCAPLGVRIEYFGFNASAVGAEKAEIAEGAWVTPESALRQADRITDNAIIMPDRLEDIAVERSQAAGQLRLRGSFDVVNIDACDHLAFCPPGRERSTFDALNALLTHQITAEHPWLLFVTTRVEPALLGRPGERFQHAVSENLTRLGTPEFGAALARALEADASVLAAAVAQAWGTRGLRFLKLYAIGLGKFLLQFFHAQRNFPARVELASAYAYRVHGETPDMLALAFRVIPEGRQALTPNVGGAAAVPLLEPRRAAYIAERAERLQDLDGELAADAGLFDAAVRNTAALLSLANYDVGAWCEWLAAHPERALAIDRGVFGF
ncbi:MAG: PP_RS20740 family protein, partial [Terriglobales bacterium]